MTDKEKELQKELEEKIKQYQYQEEENRKKLERLEKDFNKKSEKKGKSFTFVIGRFLGSLVFVYIAILIIAGILALIFGIKNYLDALNDGFNPIMLVEERYGIKLKQINREAKKEQKTIIFKVRPTNWRYRNIEFTIKRIGGKVEPLTYDDFKEHYLKFMIENIEEENKYLLDRFEIINKNNEEGLLDYKLVYNKKEEETDEEAENKVIALRNYIFEKDEDSKKIMQNISNFIYQNNDDEISEVFEIKLAS